MKKTWLFAYAKIKDQGQLHVKGAVDQHLCFSYTDSTISLNFKPVTIFSDYSAICLRPSQKSQYRFSNDAADCTCTKHYTIMILSFLTDRSGQTVHTQIRLLLKEQSDQGLHCLSFYLQILDKFLYGKTTLFEY